MPQEVRWRKQCDIDYNAGNVQTERLSRGMVYRELMLKLHMAPTTTLTNNAAGNIERGDEWGIISRIEIIANNTDVIRSFSGNDLWWLNYFWYGVYPKVSPTVGDGATANPETFCCLIIPFWMPRSIRPMDTALDARELSDLKISITWGADWTWVNNAATAWTTEPSVSVYSLESFNVKGPFNQWRVFKMTQNIPAANALFQVELPVGPMYRGFLLNLEDTTAGYTNVVDVPTGVEAAGSLINFKIVSGTTVYADLPWYMLRQILSWERISCNPTFDDATGLYDNVRRGQPANDRQAWLWFDHVTDGHNTECIDTLGFSEFKLELNVTPVGGTAPVNLNVIASQIIPVRKTR